MVEYFTALVLGYYIQEHQITTVVWFETETDCQKVMQYKLADPLYDQLYELYGNRIEMYCDSGDVHRCHQRDCGFDAFDFHFVKTSRN